MRVLVGNVTVSPRRSPMQNPIVGQVDAVDRLEQRAHEPFLAGQARQQTDHPRLGPHPEQGYLARFEASWRRIIQSLGRDREVWTAALDVIGQIEHVPELRALLAEGQREARTGSVATFDDVPEDTVDPDTARSLGSFYHALVTGVVIQWLVDPEHAPSAADLTAALRSIGARATG